MSGLINPAAVAVTGEHRLWLRFEDGLEGEVDYSGLDWSGVFAPLADPAYFARVFLDEGIRTIAWPNGADFAPETLYADVAGGAPVPEVAA